MTPAVLDETRLTPAEAAAILNTTPRTVGRWLTVGCRVGGRMVKLDGVRAGARKWLTSREAVGRFLAACTAGPEVPPAPATTASRKQAERVKERLRAKGWRV